MAERRSGRPPSLRLWATLRARFDGVALRVALPGQTVEGAHVPTPASEALWAPLQAWCFLGAGHGNRPLLQPSKPPEIQQHFAVALWSATTHHVALELVEAFSRHLDGSDELVARGAWSGLLLRLRVKACDLAWWRRRRLTDPWDCGYVLNEPIARAALARFEPRRATLMVAVAWPVGALQEAIATMAQSSSGFAHPVRWLVIEGPPTAAHDDDDIAARLRSAGLPLERLQPRADEA